MAWHQCATNLVLIRLGKDAFGGCPIESIDYAVMEKTRNAAVIPLDGGWSDIGSWSLLWQVSAQDASGNALEDDVLAIDTRNSRAVARHRFVATVGIEDLILVETANAVLVGRA